jgi:hypothetical protein
MFAYEFEETARKLDLKRLLKPLLAAEQAMARTGEPGAKKQGMSALRNEKRRRSRVCPRSSPSRSLRVAQPAGVHAQRAGPERHHLEQAAGDGQILHEMDEGVLVGEITVEQYGCGHGEHGEHHGGHTRLKADQESEAAAYLHHDSDDVAGEG